MNDWIDWNGGECPVHPDTVAERRYRSGSTGGPNPVRGLRWDHLGNSGDIVAYRVVSEAVPVSDPIGVDATPYWGGPVSDPIEMQTFGPLEPVAPAATLPTDSAKRKEYPLYEGCLAYFPAALAGVARHSKAGNDKHNPGEPLHHARGKSMDHKDCIVRHLVDLGDLLARLAPGEEILAEANALAWRALALSQELHEQIGGAPLAPGARL